MALSISRQLISDFMPLLRMQAFQRPLQNIRPARSAFRRNLLSPSQSFSRARLRFAHSNASSQAVAEGNLSLTQRLKKLLRENGKVALMVYLGLSVLDFSLVFVAIYAVGAEHVRSAEDWVLKHLHWKRRTEGEVAHSEGRAKVMDKVKDKVGDWAEKREQKNLERPSQGSGQMGSALWTTALLAYSIHKIALLPFRLGVTAAITPWVVRELQKWGWKVGPAVHAALPAAKTAAKVHT